MTQHGGRVLGRLIASVLAMSALPGCSIRQMAINQLADALSSGGESFASDPDPELIRQAAPFSLKLVESLLEETPRHQGLLLAAASGFTQYAYAFVEQEADRVEDQDLSTAQALRKRARGLYLRARGYGLRGLEARHRGITQALQSDPLRALAVTRRQDVPLLYWTAAAWGSAIGISKDDPALIADQLIVEALIDRAVALDEAWEGGALHAFLISYEPVRQGAGADVSTRVRRHFERALELSGGQMAGVFVAYAESEGVLRQNRALFERMLQQALAIDVNAQPRWRLANIIMRERARWLLSRQDELFLE